MKNTYDFSKRVVIDAELQSFVYETMIDCVKERNEMLNEILGSVDETAAETKAAIAYSYEQVLERLKSMIYIKRKDDPQNLDDLADLCRFTFNTNQIVGISKRNMDEYVGYYNILKRKFRHPEKITTEFITNIYDYVRDLVLNSGIAVPNECTLDFADVLRCYIADIYDRVNDIIMESIYIDRVTNPVNTKEFQEFIDDYFEKLSSNIEYLKSILTEENVEKFHKNKDKIHQLKRLKK